MFTKTLFATLQWHHRNDTVRTQVSQMLFDSWQVASTISVMAWNACVIQMQNQDDFSDSEFSVLYPTVTTHLRHKFIIQMNSVLKIRHGRSAAS